MKSQVGLTPDGNTSSAVQEAALIYHRVRAALMASIPAQMDAMMSREMEILARGAVDDIVAQCRQNPHQADAIIQTAVAGLSSSVRNNVQSARDRVNAIREASGGGLGKKAARFALKLAFTIDYEKSVVGAGTSQVRPMPYELAAYEQYYLEESTSALFDETQPLPEHIHMVQTEDGQWYVRVDLPEPGQFLMLPARDIRMITVSSDEEGDYRITILSEPTPRGLSDPEAAPGAVHFRHRELIWSRDALSRQIGDPLMTPERLSERLRLDPHLFDEIVQAHRAALIAELEAYRLEMDALQQCFAFQRANYLPGSFHPELPDAFMHENMPQGVVPASLPMR